MIPKMNVKLLTAGPEIGKITLNITQPEVDEWHYLGIAPKKSPSISESRECNALGKAIYENKRCAATLNTINVVERTLL